MRLIPPFEMRGSILPALNPDIEGCVGRVATQNRGGRSFSKRMYSALGSRKAHRTLHAGAVPNARRVRTENDDRDTLTSAYYADIVSR